MGLAAQFDGFCAIVMIGLTDRLLFLDSVGGGACQFLVGEAICVISSVCVYKDGDREEKR